MVRLIRLIVVSVLHIGQSFKLVTLSYSTHIAICPQLQNKTFSGLVRHITHLSSLKVCSVLITHSLLS